MYLASEILYWFAERYKNQRPEECIRVDIKSAMKQNRN